MICDTNTYVSDCCIIWLIAQGVHTHGYLQYVFCALCLYDMLDMIFSLNQVLLHSVQNLGQKMLVTTCLLFTMWNS